MTTALSTTSPGYAFFDLDHTLIPMDSDFGWGNFTVQLGWVDAQEFSRKNEAFYAQYKRGTMDIHAYIAFATRALCQRSAQECLRARAQYIEDVIAPVVLPQAIDLVRQHQAAGDTVVLVTATNAFVTEPIAPLFGIEHLIAVDLATDAQTGWYTGAVCGTPSFREGKVLRVGQWLRSRGADLQSARTTFYSDSINDLPLLQAVGTAVATNPDAPLRAIAVENGWRVLDLFGSTA